MAKQFTFTVTELDTGDVDVKFSKTAGFSLDLDNDSTLFGRVIQSIAVAVQKATDDFGATVINQSTKEL